MKIRDLLAAPKTVARVKKKTKSHESHVEREFPLESAAEGEFIAFLRANVLLPESFSFGLRYRPPAGQWAILLRVNGDHGGHRNPDGELLADVPHAHLPRDLDAEADAAGEPVAGVALPPACNRLPAAWAEFRRRANIAESPEVAAEVWELHSTLGQLDLDV